MPSGWVPTLPKTVEKSLSEGLEDTWVTGVFKACREVVESGVSRGGLILKLSHFVGWGTTAETQRRVNVTIWNTLGKRAFLSKQLMAYLRK